MQHHITTTANRLQHHPELHLSCHSSCGGWEMASTAGMLCTLGDGIVASTTTCTIHDVTWAQKKKRSQISGALAGLRIVQQPLHGSEEAL